MIKKLEVKGMNHQFNYTLGFYEEMNVLTGINGLGKTTLLKLIWYLTSGNLHRIISEIPLTSVKIETIWFELSMEQTPEGGIKLEFTHNSPKTATEAVTLDSKNLTNNLGSFNEKIASAVPGSLFFPTFRRPEGNYAAEPKMKVFQKALFEFSDALLVKVNGEKRHKFITAVSTYDIAKLLKQKHDRLSNLELKTDDFKEKEEKETLQERFKVLREIVKDIYGNSKDGYGQINIPGSISFHGQCADNREISSENLSAGEKQLLGFFCHIVFSEDAIIFIDEPESSLHVDYQRLILPLLRALKGKVKSQLFVATHSPFIYSRFTKQEINLEGAN